MSDWSKAATKRMIEDEPWDVIDIQDTSNVPPRSRWRPAPMPDNWNATHPDWNKL